MCRHEVLHLHQRRLEVADTYGHGDQALSVRRSVRFQGISRRGLDLHRRQRDYGGDHRVGGQRHGRPDRPEPGYRPLHQMEAPWTHAGQPRDQQGEGCREDQAGSASGTRPDDRRDDAPDGEERRLLTEVEQGEDNAAQQRGQPHEVPPPRRLHNPIRHEEHPDETGPHHRLPESDAREEHLGREEGDEQPRADGHLPICPPQAEPRHPRCGQDPEQGGEQLGYHTMWPQEPEKPGERPREGPDRGVERLAVPRPEVAIELAGRRGADDGQILALIRDRHAIDKDGHHHDGGQTGGRCGENYGQDRPLKGHPPDPTGVRPPHAHRPHSRADECRSEAIVQKTATSAMVAAPPTPAHAAPVTPHRPTAQAVPTTATTAPVTSGRPMRLG